MDSDNSRKTLSGTRTLTADILNLPNSINALRIKGNSGTSGQILKKNDTTNKIEWNDEQTITASLPITISSNVVGFDHGNPASTKIRKSTYHVGGQDTQIFSVGTTIKLQEHSGLIICENLDTPNVNADGILKIRDPSNHYITEVSLDKDKLDVGASNTNFYMGTADKPINEIVSNSQNVKVEFIVGDIANSNTIDINANGISGYTDHTQGAHLINFNELRLHANSPSADFVGIDTNGRGIYTRAGNINLTHGGNYGRIENVGGIDGKSGNYHLASGTDIRFIGEANVRRNITDEIQIKSFNDAGPTGSINIEINGTNNTIAGNNSTAISGIHSIATSGLTATGTIQSSGNITMTGTGGTGILTTANSAIFSAGFKQADGGGNFSVTANGTFAMNDGSFSGNVDMSGNNISNIQNITYKDNPATFAGGSASNKVVLTHCDLSSATNTPPAEPSQFTGNKIFLNNVEIQGNTILGNNDSDITTQKGILADNREFQSTNNYSSLSNYEKTFYDLNNAVSYTYKTNILNQTHHAPFASTRLSQSQNANFPYRAIKIHPTDFMKNDDHSYFDLSVYDNLGTGNAPTTGTSGIGGVKIATSSLELWHYLDIPEGLSLEAIFLRITNTGGSSFVASERLKVWKKNIGLDCVDMTKMIEIIDQDVSTSTATLYAPEPNYVGGGTGTIYEQDLINDYDSSMCMRLHLDSTSNIFMGGYALCRPTGDIRYKISVTISSFIDSFTMTYMGQDGNVSETFTSGYQTKIFYIPYRHGGSNQFIFFLSYTGTRFYDLDNVSNCLIGDGTQTAEKNWNATGTRDITCIRQEMSYVINQKNSTSSGTFNQHILHIGTRASQSVVKVTINGVSKTYNTGDTSQTFSAGDFMVINLHENYAITMFNAMGSAFTGAGITFDFTAHYGCSVSGATWDGDNSSPITINFAQADSSLVFNLT